MLKIREKIANIFLIAKKNIPDTLLKNSAYPYPDTEYVEFFVSVSRVSIFFGTLFITLHRSMSAK